MSVVFDIVIAFVVLVIAVVVIKYALILGAAVLAVLWNGVVILLRNRWITAFFGGAVAVSADCALCPWI